MFCSLKIRPLYGAALPVFFTTLIEHFATTIDKTPSTLTKFQNVHFLTTLRQGRGASAEGNRFAIGPRFASFQSVHGDTLLFCVTHVAVVVVVYKTAAASKRMAFISVASFPFFSFCFVRKPQTNKLRMPLGSALFIALFLLCCVLFFLFCLLLTGDNQFPITITNKT